MHAVCGALAYVSTHTWRTLPTQQAYSICRCCPVVGAAGVTASNALSLTMRSHGTCNCGITLSSDVCVACPTAVLLLLTGNSTALSALLFASAYLTVGDLSAAASNLYGTIASANVSLQEGQQAYQEALGQALQLPSSDAVAILAAAAVANNQTTTIADAFAQVSLASPLCQSSPVSLATMSSDRSNAFCSYPAWYLCYFRCAA